jgi:hypothetical protein
MLRRNYAAALSRHVAPLRVRACGPVPRCWRATGASFLSHAWRSIAIVH